jgi:hypothetical protein
LDNGGLPCIAWLLVRLFVVVVGRIARFVRLVEVANFDIEMLPPPEVDESGYIARYRKWGLYRPHSLPGLPPGGAIIRLDFAVLNGYLRVLPQKKAGVG